MAKNIILGSTATSRKLTEFPLGCNRASLLRFHILAKATALSTDLEGALATFAPCLVPSESKVIGGQRKPLAQLPPGPPGVINRNRDPGTHSSPSMQDPDVASMKLYGGDLN